MLYVVIKETDKVVGRFEAWSCSCFEDAQEIIDAKGYRLVEEKITSMGDMIWYVEKIH